MYKVILADDEPYILSDLQKLADWGGLGFTLVSTAHDGKEADMLVRHHSPHLLISDIRMPGLSGLELLERVRRHSGGCLVILLSAYSDFEYAQRALQLGAFDYLLKPVAADKLAEVLQKARARLEDAERRTRELTRLAQANWLFQVLDGNCAEEGAPLPAEMSRTQFRNMLAVVLKSLPDGPPIEQAVDAFHSLIPLGVMTPVGPRKGFGFFPLDQLPQGSFPLMSKAMRLGRQHSVSIGVSQPFNGIRRLRAALGQADNMAHCDFLIGRGGLHLASRFQPDRVKELVRRITASQSKDHLREQISSLPGAIPPRRLTPEALSQLHAAFLHAYTKLYGSNELEPLSGKDITVFFQNPGEFWESMLEILNEGRKAPYKSGSGQIVSDIIQEIQARYQEKITLNSFAEKYHLNVSYLSSLFKEETGLPYTSYLVEIRLNKALELLEDGGCSLSDIGSEVGYDDYYHFSKLFKKYKGVSPSAYRRKLEAADRRLP